MRYSEYYASIEAKGHRLKRLSNGEVDFFVLEYECHNGPGCVLCGESWCEYCQPEVLTCPNAVIDAVIVVQKALEGLKTQ